ncbi:MAG TPA: hypothetical protein VFC65_07475 [Prolixibacteraceae bacterium]|nr:hypothetical protein [Prolixibacteraceae bacterium]
MVSLIERNSYVSDLKRNTKFNQFISFVNCSSVERIDYDIEIDRLFNNTLLSIKQGNKQLFHQVYSQISERQPNKNSPILHEDLLLFALIVGLIKFKSESNWLIRAIQSRESSEKEGTLIKNTFLSILNGNYKNKENLFQVIIVIENLLDLELISWEEKSDFYAKITSDKLDLYKSDFLNIISLRAFDIVLIEGDKSDTSNFAFLSSFEKKFLNRTNIISNIIYFILVIAVATALIKFAVNPKYKDIIDKFFPISGAIGISILSLVSRKKLIPFFENGIKLGFGYKKK